MSDRVRGLLDDELAALLDGDAADRPADFDDAMYLQLNQDVAAAVTSGVYSSGFEHYMKYGAKEGRRYRNDPLEGAVPAAEAASALARAANRPAPPMPPHSVDVLRISPGGAFFLVGWLDDATDGLAELVVEGDGWAVDVAGVALARIRRQDVEGALGASVRHSFGFWSLFELGRDLPRQGLCRVRFRMRSGANATLEVESKTMPDAELRDLALGYLASADFFGNPHYSAIASLDGGIAEHIIANNCRISRDHQANPYVERFAQTTRPLKGSIVVCLYGKPEYLFLQNTLFAGKPGIEDYEFVYVCNSPELAERLLRDAKIAATVHGLPQTLVLLNGNAGFGGANNVAASYARSDRIMAVNPDVFPLHEDWARRHTDAIDNLPREQTTMFGVPLYYDDGSLMHGGMFFEIDSVPIALPGGLTRRDLVRVEHYGKGAPPNTHAFTRARPVPAVTGAFISSRRDWFEKLGGFTEDFVFGHYEDADLCLRSLAQGVPAWMHDIRLWHLEGKGSTRLKVHEGGSLVNRWLFSRRWAAEIRAGLLGPQPAHALLTPPPDEAAPPAPAASGPAGPAPDAERLGAGGLGAGGLGAEGLGAEGLGAEGLGAEEPGARAADAPQEVAAPAESAPAESGPAGATPGAMAGEMRHAAAGEARGRAAKREPRRPRGDVRASEGAG